MNSDFGNRVHNGPLAHRWRPATHRVHCSEPLPNHCPRPEAADIFERVARFHQSWLVPFEFAQQASQKDH